MHLVIPCRESATRHYKKFDGLLLQSIDKAQKQEPDTIIWTAANSDSTWVKAFSETPKEELFSLPTIVIQQPSNPFELGRGIAMSSPSSLEGGGKTNINERFAGGTNEAFDRGTIVHRWLEDIEWLEKLPTIQTLIETAPRDEAARFCEEGLLHIAQSVIHALQTNEIQQLLTKPEGDSKVYREQDFALRVAAGTQLGKLSLREPTDIRGSIDRLVVYYDDSGDPIRAHVIDWKTDSYSPDERSEKIEHYAPQLSSYRLAAATLLGIDLSDVSAYLVFISSGEIHDITNET